MLCNAFVCSMMIQCKCSGWLLLNARWYADMPNLEVYRLKVSVATWLILVTQTWWERGQNFFDHTTAHHRELLLSQHRSHSAQASPRLKPCASDDRDSLSTTVIHSTQMNYVCCSSYKTDILKVEILFSNLVLNENKLLNNHHSNITLFLRHIINVIIISHMCTYTEVQAGIGGDFNTSTAPCSPTRIPSTSAWTLSQCRMLGRCNPWCPRGCRWGSPRYGRSSIPLRHILMKPGNLIIYGILILVANLYERWKLR